MGLLLCCFGVPDDENYGQSNDHEEIQGLNATNELSAPLDFGLIIQEIKNTRDNRIQIVVATEARDQKDFVNHSQVQVVPEPKPEPKLETKPEPEPVLKSKTLITYKSILLGGDCALSRDDECAICLEEYDSENPRITTKCNHHWHLSCIFEWQNISELCPNCAVVMEFEEME